MFDKYNPNLSKDSDTEKIRFGKIALVSAILILIVVFVIVMYFTGFFTLTSPGQQTVTAQIIP